LWNTEWEQSTKAVNTHFICALTAHANKSDVEACIKSGMDKYATRCNTLQHTCNIPQYTATHRDTPQHTATHCNTLQHTATRNQPDLEACIKSDMHKCAAHCITPHHTATHRKCDVEACAEWHGHIYVYTYICICKSAAEALISCRLTCT